MTRPESFQETCVSVLTPAGRGAVAVVSIKGSAATAAVDSRFLAKNGRTLDKQPLQRIVYGHWGTEDGEDLVVCRKAPDEVEVHCHGGSQSVAIVVSQLVSAGCREIPWRQWIADLQDCPITCEAQIALAESISSRTALILLEQYQGALRRELEAILALIANEDFSLASTRLAILLQRIPWGLRLTKPWRIVIAGRPNVGKSSLVNTLVGYRRAIVFDQPGTTRDVVSTNTVIAGWPVLLSDTAGLHDTTNALEFAGIQRAHAQLAEADLVVWVEDVLALEPTAVSTWPTLIKARAAELELRHSARQILVLNKVDCCEPLPTLPSDILGTSALTGWGVEQLLSAIATQLVPELPEVGAAVPFTVRQASLLQTAATACAENSGECVRASIEELLTGEITSNV